MLIIFISLSHIKRSSDGGDFFFFSVVSMNRNITYF